jgi:hypothetical protein
MLPPHRAMVLTLAILVAGAFGPVERLALAG